MLVAAKCVAPAWDGVSCVGYVPGGGPLPDGLYEIERDGPLASLKVGQVYVFAFDRNAGPDDKPHDYSCKKDGCGAKFKTLNALGTHTREAHKDDPHPLAEPDAEVVVAKDLRGKTRKVTTFTCKHPGCGEVLPHLYALRVHKNTHEVAVTQAA